MNILDIGTGPGTIPIALMDRYDNFSDIKIYGIDLSQVAISNAIKIVKSFGLQKLISYKLGSFEDIPFPENSFDVVISNASFNLCTNKTKAIDEVIRVIKKLGQALIADCFKKEDECQRIDNDEKLWDHCISGSITVKWLVSIFNSKKLFLKHKENLTEIVKSLILNEKWKWREFIDYYLDYFSLLFSF